MVRMPAPREVYGSRRGGPRMRTLVGTVGQSVLVTDDGATWKQLPVEIAAECPAVGVPRVTDIAIDPLEPTKLWASIEVDGMRRSIDGGESWQRIDGGITNPDGHAATVTSGPPKSVVLTVNNEIFVSRDDGVTWQPVGVKQHFPYTHIRDVV